MTARQTNRRDRGFPPIARRDAHTLILGSLPGRRSLEMRQYYAHPQNCFWRIMGRLFGLDGLPPYARRVRILETNRIAVWDVLAAAQRPGSLDSSIVHASALANDFRAFFRAHPAIRRVFFNGRKAAQMYERFVLPGLGAEHADLRYETLPSTSPAHAGVSFAGKLARWGVLSVDRRARSRFPASPEKSNRRHPAARPSRRPPRR
jgi:TDG/mug DNA glycosylase family protein